MKPLSQVVAILLLLTYILASSKYAYSYYDDKYFSYSDPWPLSTQTNIEPESEFARIFSILERAAKEAAERAAKEAAETALNRSPPVPDNVPRDRLDPDTPGGVLRAQADVTAMAIISITDLVGSNVQLIRILEDIAYSPIRHGWKEFPAQHLLENVYKEAENFIPGGGNNLLAYVVHRLAERYESVPYDPALKGFHAIQPTRPIKFKFYFDESELLSPTSVRLPGEIKVTINAIVKYCDPCDVLGGMRGILEHHLGAKDAYDILSSSKSNIQALERAYNRLSPQDANARLKNMIEILQRNYESARQTDIFNAFMDLPPPDLKPGVIEEFRSSVRARIELETHVDAQVGHPSEPRAQGPAIP